jgi:Glu-tRNA(Gln) amidotransferase subunit E-like FAD-binding protein
MRPANRPSDHQSASISQKLTGIRQPSPWQLKKRSGEHPKALEDYRAGKNGALNFLVGQVMKKTRGKADPGELNRMLVTSLKNKEP